jgi:hypothetical protein
VMHAHYHIVEGGVTQRICHAFEYCAPL